MVNRDSNSADNQTNHRRYVRVVAVVVLVVSVVVLIMSFFSKDVIVVNDFSQSTSTPTEVSEYSVSASEPTRIRIPSVGISTTFEEPLSLNQDRTIQVPDSYEQVGWYKGGVTPGEIGSSVILGHVDSYEGPAVFFSLGQIEEGALIEITRNDGSVATFSVTALERYEQEEFPTELVYGDVDHAGLRLVTCSGTFDKGEQVYSHNTVVYAELVQPEDIEE